MNSFLLIGGMVISIAFILHFLWTEAINKKEEAKEIGRLSEKINGLLCRFSLINALHNLGLDRETWH